MRLRGERVALRMTQTVSTKRLGGALEAPSRAAPSGERETVAARRAGGS